MRLRGSEPSDLPDRLLHYEATDWPSAQAWREARRRWVAVHPPASLAALNQLYAPAVVFPPRPDPRVAA